MATKPTLNDARWGETSGGAEGANNVAATEGKKDTGFGTSAEQLAGSLLNWMFHEAYKWFRYVDDFLATANTWTALQTFPAGISVEDILVADDLTVNDDLAVVGDAGISGTLTVSAGLSGSSASFSSTLGVTGAATLSSTLGVTGAATVGSLACTGVATVGGTLGVTGAATLSGALNVGGIAQLSGGLQVTRSDGGSAITVTDGSSNVRGDIRMAVRSSQPSGAAEGDMWVYFDSGLEKTWLCVYSNGGIRKVELTT